VLIQPKVPIPVNKALIVISEFAPRIHRAETSSVHVRVQRKP